MTVHSLQRAGAGWSAQTDTRTHRYVCKTRGLTDEQLFDWLTTNHGANFGPLGEVGLSVEQPSGTATAGYPLLPEWDGRPLSGLDCELAADAGLGGFDYWKVVATYEPEGGGSGGGGAADRPVGEAGITFAFDIGPEEGLVTQSLETLVSRGPLTGTAPDLSQAINVQPDGSVSGVNSPTAPSKFSLEYTNTAAFFTNAKLAEFTRMVGKVHSGASFFGHDAGEVRMIGVSGRLSTAGNTTLELSYGVIENETDIEIPGIALVNGSGIDKDGWDYLWVYYGHGHDSGKITSSPRGAYVERIFKRADLRSIF